jgi:hypothetical protein
MKERKERGNKERERERKKKERKEMIHRVFVQVLLLLES